MAIHNLPTKKDRKKALQEINRVLKPSGKIALLDFKYIHDYENTFREMGWKDLQKSKYYFWQFPPVRILSGKSPKK